METKYYTLEEVKEHNTDKSIWIVLDNCVYDLTEFLFQHPGGEEVLMDRAGGDGTDCFDNIGHSADAKVLREQYKIGEVVKSQWKDKAAPQPSTSYDEEYKYEPKKPPVNIVQDYLIPLAVVLAAFYFFFFVF